MKKFATIAISLWASVVVSHAQGTMNFANAGAGFLAQVHIDTIAGPLVTSTSYMAQLLLVGAGNSLTPIGAAANFLGSGGPGFFNGGVVDSGLTAGATGTFQVFAWDGASGQAAYAAALAAWNGGSIHGGYSNPVTVPTGGTGSPAGPPGALTGLQPWAVTIVPEPSTIALGIIGGLALLLRRRK
jgi:hypothetical protein